MGGMCFSFFEECSIPVNHLPAAWRSPDALSELHRFLQFSWDQRNLLYEDHNSLTKQCFLNFNGTQSIHTNNYIGIIFFKGQYLYIYPKVFRECKSKDDTSCLSPAHLQKNILEWLKHCSIANPHFFNMPSDLEDCQELRELFITIYLNYVRKAVTSQPFYQYVDKCEDLRTLRGQIDIRDYLTAKIPHGLHHLIRCSFSEFEFDNKVNRIIKYACSTLTNITQSKLNRKAIRLAQIRLNGVSDLPFTPADCDGFHFSKLQRCYEMIMRMSKMILLMQMNSYAAGMAGAFCFLFPTELLFEGFIGGLMKATLKRAKVTLQAHDQKLISNVSYGGQSLGGAFTMRHDILVTLEDKTIVLDTKYKQLSRFEGNTCLKETLASEISQQDLYQVIEYAAHRDLQDAYLLYPMYRHESAEPFPVILERQSVSGKKVLVHIMRLPFVFEDDTSITKNVLTQEIMKILS